MPVNAPQAGRIAYADEMEECGTHEPDSLSVKADTIKCEASSRLESGGQHTLYTHFSRCQQQLCSKVPKYKYLDPLRYESYSPLIVPETVSS